MSGSKSNKAKKSNKKVSKSQMVDVLYQKLGENWFAFSLIDGDVFMSQVSEEKIAEIKNDESAVSSIRPSGSESDNEAA